MKKYIIFLLVCILNLHASYADTIYPAFTIPESLKKDAHAVIRLHETTFTVKSLGEAVNKVHYVVTILDEQGKNHSQIQVDYNKLSKITFIEGALYDELGKQVKRLKKSDIQDVSNFDNSQLFTDNRTKFAEFVRVQYPYTVEFEYEVVEQNMLFYPWWRPQDQKNLSVEKASFELIIPPGVEIKYKELNLPTPIQITNLPEGKKHRWSVKDLVALETEPNSPSFIYQIPSVVTTPLEFQVEGFQGSMRTWSDLSKFFYDLNEGRDVLPETVKQKILQLTANETNQTNKIKKLYEYMQANTRYVGVQLGIGGWQTIPASIVAEKGYGDCKALSNYMKAMLNVAGIPSFCASIYAGEGKEESLVDFPNPFFNHVILCIPQAKDTIWLECTSQTKSFGYQGSSTGNRYALLEAPSGGRLLKTTHYLAKENLQTRTVSVFLDENGDSKVEATTHYTGEQQDDINSMINYLGHEDQKKQLYKRIDIPSFEINQFSFIEKKARIPSVIEKLSLTVRKCGSKSGTRMFIAPNLMNASTYIPPKAENRKNDLVIRTAYQDVDTVVYHLPKGYGIEFIPETIKIESKFGSYQSSLQNKEGEITYIRTVTVNRGRYPASVYNDWVDFRKKIAKADKTQMVLVNKGS